MKFRKVGVLVSALMVAAIAVPATPAAAKWAPPATGSTAVQRDVPADVRNPQDTPAGAMPTAPSATAGDPTTMSCYGSARSYSTDSLHEWPSGGWAVTTSNCNDINVRPNSGTYVRACLWYSSTQSVKCNTSRWISGGTWGVAATDVFDGTYFYLKFDRPSSGLTAY